MHLGDIAIAGALHLGAALLDPLRARLQYLCGGVALVLCVAAHARLPQYGAESAIDSAHNTADLALIIAALAHALRHATIPLEPHLSTLVGARLLDARLSAT